MRNDVRKLRMATGLSQRELGELPAGLQIGVARGSSRFLGDSSGALWRSVTLMPVVVKHLMRRLA